VIDCDSGHSNYQVELSRDVQQLVPTVITVSRGAGKSGSSQHGPLVGPFSAILSAPSGRLFLEQPAVAGCAKPNVHPRRGPRSSALPDSALPFVTLCFFMQAARLLHNASPPRTPNQLPAFLNPLPVNPLPTSHPISSPWPCLSPGCIYVQPPTALGLYPASCDDPTVSYVSNAASSAPWDIISNSTKDERPSHDVHFLFVLSAVVNSCFVTCRGSASSSEHLARQHRRRAGPSTRQRPSSFRHRLSR
jgi:hypothetical protein